MKKRTPPRGLFALLCVVSLLLCSTLLAACDMLQTNKTFNVTVAEYDAAQGSVTVSAPASGEKYADGEEVTVTVEPKTGYEVATFTVSGHSDAALDANNKYTFKVTADTTVTVTFTAEAPKEFTQAMLDSVKGDLHLTGTYTMISVGETNQNYTADVESIMTSDAYYNKEVRPRTNELYELTAFKNAEGKPVDYFLKRDNTIDEAVIRNDTDNDGHADTDTDWATDFANPFDSLTTADFTATSESGVFALSADKIDNAAYIFTRYLEEFDTFTVTVENGAVTEIDFAYDWTGDSTSAHCENHFTVAAHGSDVTAPTRPAPKPETANHALLAAALEALKTANFTMNRRLVEGTNNPSDVNFNVYYADDAFFYDYKTDDIYSTMKPSGAAVLSNGDIYEFTYDAKQIIKGDKAAANSIKAYNPKVNIAAALFEDKGDGVFEAYDITFAEVHNMSLAQVAATSIDNNSDRGNFATDFRIELSDDMTRVEKVTYNISLLGVPGTVTLTFSNFGTTTVPIPDLIETLEAGGDEPADDFPGPIGTFTAKNITGTIPGVTEGTTIVLTKETITIGDGQPITFESNGSYLHFTYEGGLWSAEYYGEQYGGWCIQKGGDWFYLELVDPQPPTPPGPSVTFPGETGTFTVTQATGTTDITVGMVVIITNTTIKFGDDDPVTFTVDGTHLEFTYKDLNFKTDWYDTYWLLTANSYAVMVYLYPQTPQIDFPGGAGTYVAEANDLGITTVIITETTIQFGDEAPITFTLTEDYMGTKLVFEYQNKQFTASYDDWFTQWTLEIVDEYEEIRLSPPPSFPEGGAGTYTAGSNSLGITKVVITETTIQFDGGEEITFTLQKTASDTKLVFEYLGYNFEAKYFYAWTLTYYDEKGDPTSFYLTTATA